MTWRLIIIAVLIVLLIPTMALLRKQEAVKKDRRQRADCRCAKTAQCFLRSAHRAVCVCAGCHDVQCVFCEILEKKQKFFAKTLDQFPFGLVY